jgi:pyruvate dehydrogenase E2 component (dihydrolipoamide acetyltransferase)
MPLDLKLPVLGDVMVEGTLASWLKEDGAAVARGEPIYQLETDKVNYAVEAPASGILRQVVAAGETVPVGTVVGRLVESTGAEPPEHPRREAPASREVRASPAARRMARELGVDISAMGATRRIRSTDVAAYASSATAPTAPADVRATPAARRLARELGIALDRLATGRLLRARDVMLTSSPPAAPAAPEPPAAVEPAGAQQRQLSGRRRVIAERMHASLQSMAQLTASLEVDFTEALRLRAQLSQLWPAEEKPSITDLVIKAAVLALAEHPDLNATLEHDTLSLHQEVNVGLAVDAPGGLIVPVVQGAQAMSLRQLAAATTSLANKARDDALTLAELQGGTFTVTTLGQLGVDFFTPIVNPPQVAILGIGRVFDKLVMVDREVAQRSAMYLNLSFDHRVIDGAPAARFLNTVKRLLELPVALVAT